MFLQHYLLSCKYCKCQNQSDEITFALLMNFNKVFKSFKMLFTIAKCFKRKLFKIKLAAYEYIAAGCLFSLYSVDWPCSGNVVYKGAKSKAHSDDKYNINVYLKELNLKTFIMFKFVIQRLLNHKILYFVCLVFCIIHYDAAKLVLMLLENYSKYIDRHNTLSNFINIHVALIILYLIVFW